MGSNSPLRPHLARLSTALLQDVLAKADGAAIGCRDIDRAMTSARVCEINYQGQPVKVTVLVEAQK